MGCEGGALMKKLPVGIDNFEEVIAQNYYYVDKTLFVKDILDSGAKATLIPRPRRFGKTLNMSMLRCFFEKTIPSRASLFDGLAIAQDQESMAHQGQYPLIFLTFKFIDSLVWDKCFEKLKRIIADEYNRHRYLLDGPLLNDAQKEIFNQIIVHTASEVSYEVSLKNLIVYLADYHQKDPIVLIDEYDVPIHAGFRHNYFVQVVSFVRSFLGDGLKGNDKLKFAVVTGALRVAKESIFTGLNNLEVSTFLSDSYADKFGLLAEEVRALVTYYQLETDPCAIQAWYNGYTSGGYTVYNPWSIINLAKQKGALQPYWINTSSNDIIKTLIKDSADDVKEDIEKLLAHEAITKEIRENIVYGEIQNSSHILWSFLLFSGYLTFKNKRIVDGTMYADLIIPNSEVISFYKTTILAWFEEQPGGREYSEMLKSLVAGDVTTFKKIFSVFVLTSFSYFDVSEAKPVRKFRYSPYFCKNQR